VADRLYRSPADRVIAGVAGGLATWLNLDPSLVRVAWVLLAIVSGGVFVLVYIVMMIVVPLPPPGWVPRPRGPVGGTPGGAGRPAGPGAPGAVPGWQAPDGATWGSATGSAPAAGPAAGTGWSTPSPAWTPPRFDTGNAGIVLGVVLVLLGAWFLVDRYLPVDWDLLWPVVVIGLGIVLIVGAMRHNRSSGA
jgi:phage shock protein C